MTKVSFSQIFGLFFQVFSTNFSIFSQKSLQFGDLSGGTLSHPLTVSQLDALLGEYFFKKKPPPVAAEPHGRTLKVPPVPGGRGGSARCLCLNKTKTGCETVL